MNFSVVIATKNRSKKLERLLNQLNNSAKDYSNHVEVICVDNMSTDNTQSIIERLRNNKLFFSLLCVSEKKIGPSHARNKGIKQARYRHIIFIDDDCIVNPNFFSLYAKAWKKYPNSAIIGGRVKAIKEDGTPLSHKEQRIISNHPWCFGELDLYKNRVINLGQFLCGANLSIDRNKIRNKTVFNTQLGTKYNNKILYAEDYELCNRLNLDKSVIRYIHHPEVFNQVKKERFSYFFILKRYFNAGIEQKIMESILRKKFSNKPNFYKIKHLHPLLQSINNIIHFRLIRVSVYTIFTYLSSPMKICYFLGYLSTAVRN